MEEIRKQSSFDKLSPKGQRDYVKKHPNTRFTVNKHENVDFEDWQDVDNLLEPEEMKQDEQVLLEMNDILPASIVFIYRDNYGVKTIETDNGEVYKLGNFDSLLNAFKSELEYCEIYRPNSVTCLIQDEIKLSDGYKMYDYKVKHDIYLDILRLSDQAKSIEHRFETLLEAASYLLFKEHELDWNESSTKDMKLHLIYNMKGSLLDVLLDLAGFDDYERFVYQDLYNSDVQKFVNTKYIKNKNYEKNEGLINLIKSEYGGLNCREYTREALQDPAKMKKWFDCEIIANKSEYILIKE